MLREARAEVRVELAPVLGEVERAPAARDLREVGRVRVRERGGSEEGAGVEEMAALGAELEVLLLVEADAEEMGRPVFWSTVPAARCSYMLLGYT